MEVVVRSVREASLEVGLLVLLETERATSDPRASATLDPLARRLDERLGGWLSSLLRSASFRGRAQETAMLHPPAGGPVLLIGLGPREALRADHLRVAAAIAVRRARDLAIARTALRPSATRLEWPAVAQALAEGAALGAHRYGAKTPDRFPERVELRVPGAATAPLAAAARRGVAWARATTLARDLANTPPNDLVPADLAARARTIAARSGARIRVLGERELRQLGMGALLAVGQGSQNPPRFMVLDRPPGGSRTRAGRAAGRRAATGGVALIGKGVTFDTGGISLKPREGMQRMKYDLSGAAAVLGVFSALPELDPPFRVVGLIPSAENMPGGRAFKPGDVVRALDGTTIEVTNTDAEGRLLLADALAFTRREAPEVVVDLATLTGSVRLTLGGHAAGLFTADEPLARELLRASEVSGERLWRLPLGDEYAEALRSDVADLVNSAGPEGGASIAASFLARFARGMRWAHLDIASTAWAFQERPHEPRGGTGFGARLVLEWLSERAASGISRRGAASRAARRAPPSTPRPGSRARTSARGSRTTAPRG